MYVFVLVLRIKYSNPGQVPQLRRIVGDELSKSFSDVVQNPSSTTEQKKAALKQLFHGLVTAEITFVQEQLKELIRSINEKTTEKTDLEKWVRSFVVCFA